MFVMDMPDVPPQYAPIIVAEVSQAKRQNTERTIGVCHLVENKPESRLSAVNAMSPAAAAWGYLKSQAQTNLNEADYTSAKFTLLQTPEHGELELHEPTQSAGYFSTDFNYEGPDKATVLVEIGGYKVKVIYFFNLMPHVPSGTQFDPYIDKKYCPEGKGRVWKISLNNPNDSTAQLLTFNSPTQLTSYLAGAINVDINIADLAGGAVGQTTGTTITLDTNAAGHGWFIDTTPGDNAEFGRLG